MTKVVITGAAGRMGVALIRCISDDPEFELIAATEAPGHEAIGRDSGLLAGLAENGIRVSDDLDAALSQADAVIDFSWHEAVPALADAATRHHVRLVVGTTGLSDEEAAKLHEAARSIRVVWAPNMSLGVNLLFATVKRAAQLLDEDYDIEIVEMHHRHKRDAPSGTALKLAEKAAEGRGVDLNAVGVHGRTGITGERPRGEIGVHAVRGGDVFGDHVVTFAGEGERVEFVHRLSSRSALARGALVAATWLAGKQPGMYDMQAVLGL